MYLQLCKCCDLCTNIKYAQRSVRYQLVPPVLRLLTFDLLANGLNWRFPFLQVSKQVSRGEMRQIELTQCVANVAMPPCSVDQRVEPVDQCLPC
ncbi:hypothetical protein RIF29_36307 [Crotalaria pallida]|uniref:Uncharacterized protein n=1 Tax=Crotalaria pallida TaxID=3830 RepID=A0AAN9HU95_CROPI